MLVEETSILPMEDREISELVEIRMRARQAGDYALADSIRKKLQQLPECVEIQDFKSGPSRWYRTMLSMEEREAILSRYPK